MDGCFEITKDLDWFMDVLILMSSAADIATIPAYLFAKSCYGSPEDAVIKALGIE